MKNWIMFLKGDENLWGDEYFRELDSHINEAHREDFYGHLPRQHIYERPYYFTLYLGPEEKCSKENVVAYLQGHIMWDWMKIETIWVNEVNRRLGLGSKLLEQAEILAREHKLIGIQLQSWSKSLARFYDKVGFALVFELMNHPVGTSCFYHVKYL